jgi:hypothetical protein
MPIGVDPEGVMLILGPVDSAPEVTSDPEIVGGPGEMVEFPVATMLEDEGLDDTPVVVVMFDQNGLTVDETSLDEAPVQVRVILDTVRLELRKEVIQVLDSPEGAPVVSDVLTVVFAFVTELEAEPADEVLVNGGLPEIEGAAGVLGDGITVLPLIMDNVMVISGPVGATSDVPLLIGEEDSCVVLEIDAEVDIDILAEEVVIVKVVI